MYESKAFLRNVMFSFQAALLEGGEIYYRTATKILIRKCPVAVRCLEYQVIDPFVSVKAYIV